MMQPPRHAAIPLRSEIARINAEAEEERRRIAYQSGRFAELFSQILAVISGRKSDAAQCDD